MPTAAPSAKIAITIGLVPEIAVIAAIAPPMLKTIAPNTMRRCDEASSAQSHPESRPQLVHGVFI